MARACGLRRRYGFGDSRARRSGTAGWVQSRSNKNETETRRWVPSLIVFATGDGGYGTNYPAISPYVTAVGGTTLVRTASGSRAWSETASSSGGSGCSAYEPKPAWQHDIGCAFRTVSDVAAVGDPNTGVAIYDSTPYFFQSGWLVAGGTSVAAPLVAGVYALAGNSGSLNAGSSPYSNPGSLFDVVSGSNGSCGGSYLCTAGPGYDGPTGLGTPNGVTAF